MRRRGITLLVLMFGILVSMQNKINFVQSKDNTIPQEAVRLRIIANSNSDFDQELKLKVRDEVLSIIYPKVKDVTNRDEARKIIYDSLADLDAGVKTVLEQNDSADLPYTVNYGITAFPEKLYGNSLYPAGDYEAVLIVLGEGKGDNWWCVLFPPLCLVSVASDGQMTYTEDTDVHYSFLIVEKLKELFGYK